MEQDTEDLRVRKSRKNTEESNENKITNEKLHFRPLGTMSAYQSKILRRRDKTFLNSSPRSQSQPRQAERLSSPEANELLNKVKRSLSSPRQKNETSDDQDALSPGRQNKKRSENLRRLEQNLRKFEEDRQRIKLEKRLFEEEKRDYRLRSRQLKDHEKRKRLLQNCKIINENMQERRDVEDRCRNDQALETSPKEESYRFLPSGIKLRNLHESSSPISSSDSEKVYTDSKTILPYSEKSNLTASKDMVSSFDLKQNTLLPRKRNEKSQIPEQTRDEGVCIASVNESIMFDQNANRSYVSTQEGNKRTDGGSRSNSINNAPSPRELLTKQFFQQVLFEISREWKRLKVDFPNELKEIEYIRNKCIAHTIILILFCGFGGLLFRYTEGAFEDIYKCKVLKVRRDFIDYLWTASHNMREDDWKSEARNKLRKFEEELNALQEMGIRQYPGKSSWNFVNCILYCWTLVTTIGYGHITPQTTLGRSLTIVYAIIGIPIFLILLADFGKLFTRCMKFMLAFVRRLSCTATCQQVRKHQQFRNVVDGLNRIYDFFIRRPRTFFSRSNQTLQDTSSRKVFQIDDEFNLPVSLATILLTSYILIGAFFYTCWEDWTYFEAFYFVFISISTIGFGDFIPNHPILMMCSVIYMVFGLALTSMFINVVQKKLNNTFKQASAKIRTTIGLGLTVKDGGKNIESQSTKISSDITFIHNPLDHSIMKVNSSGENFKN